MTANGTIERLTQAELNQFEAQLLERRHVLLSDLQALEKTDLRDDSQPAGLTSHLADLGSDRAAADLSLGCRETAYLEIQQIDEALERIKDGSYGLCETCDGPMAKARLEAIPYARLCLSCKQQEER